MSLETIVIVIQVAKMGGSKMKIGCALNVMVLVILVLQRSTISELLVPLD